MRDHQSPVRLEVDLGLERYHSIWESCAPHATDTVRWGKRPPDLSSVVFVGGINLDTIFARTWVSIRQEARTTHLPFIPLQNITPGGTLRREDIVSRAPITVTLFRGSEDEDTEVKVILPEPPK